MQRRELACPNCGGPFDVDGAVRSAACPSCRLWLHAATCTVCGEGVVALGNGDQVCPWCGSPQRIVDMGIRTFDGVAGPMGASLSRVSVRRPVPRQPSPSVAPSRYGTQAHVSSLLYALALLFAVAGVIASVAVGHVYSEAHATGGATAVAVAVVAGLAVAIVSVLGALAYLVDLTVMVDTSVRVRADDLEAAIRRWAEPQA